MSLGAPGKDRPDQHLPDPDWCRCGHPRHRHITPGICDSCECLKFAPEATFDEAWVADRRKLQEYEKAGWRLVPQSVMDQWWVYPPEGCGEMIRVNLAYDPTPHLTLIRAAIEARIVETEAQR